MSTEAADKDLRFIPTGVGNTTSNTSPNILCTVHPHGCGEHKILSLL